MLIWTAIVAVLLCFHFAVCFYAYTNSEAVAAIVSQPERSYLAWLFLSILRVQRGNDAELDLVQPGLPHQAVVANTQRRAAIGMMTTGGAALCLILFLLVLSYAPGILRGSF